ncbi:unnamed protein product, partial [Ectocarpus fasciculatus]
SNSRLYLRRHQLALVLGENTEKQGYLSFWRHPFGHKRLFERNPPTTNASHGHCCTKLSIYTTNRDKTTTSSTNTTQGNAAAHTSPRKHTLQHQHVQSLLTRLKTSAKTAAAYPPRPSRPII